MTSTDFVPRAGDVLPLFLAPVDGDPPPPLGLVVELHRTNGRIWAYEDEIRATDADVVRLRRQIERLNLRRNELIDRVNAAYARLLRPAPDAPLVTEAPGSALDRLSVLALRLVHTRSRARTEPTLRGRLPGIEEHLADLRQAIDTLIDDVREGRRRFPVYGAAKIYG